MFDFAVLIFFVNGVFLSWISSELTAHLQAILIW